MSDAAMPAEIAPRMGFSEGSEGKGERIAPFWLISVAWLGLA